MIQRILLILGFVFISASCVLFSKKVEASQTKEVLKTENKMFDSITSLSKTLPIHDVFEVSLKTNNPSIDSVIDIRLKNLLIIKSSGNNSASVKYNSKTKGLEIVTKVASSETKNIQSSRKSNTKNTEKKSVKKSKTKTNNFSWWIYILIAIGLVTLLKFKKKLLFLCINI